MVRKDHHNGLFFVIVITISYNVKMPVPLTQSGIDEKITKSVLENTRNTFIFRKKINFL